MSRFSRWPAQLSSLVATALLLVGAPLWAGEPGTWAPVTANDATSGVASPCVGASCNFTQSTTTNGSAVQIPSGAVCDVAGNCNPGVTAGPYKIDTVPPTLTCQSPAPTFILNQPGTSLSATVTDATSGPAQTPVSANADTSTVGLKTASVTGFDVAGNSTAKNCSYSVIYNFIGLQAPYAPPPKAFKLNSTIPLKWQYADFAGNILNSSSAAPEGQILPSSCTGDGTGDPILIQDAGNSGLQYDSLTNTWQYNWQTKGLGSTCYGIRIKSAQTGQVDPFFAAFFDPVEVGGLPKDQKA